MNCNKINNAKKHCRKGSYFYGLANYTAVIKEYDKAIGYQKDAPEAYFSKTACLMQWGNYEESISECNKAMACQSNESIQD